MQWEAPSSPESSCGRQLLRCYPMSGDPILIEVDADATVGQIHSKIKEQTRDHQKRSIAVVYNGVSYHSDYDRIMLTRDMCEARRRLRKNGDATTPIEITIVDENAAPAATEDGGHVI